MLNGHTVHEPTVFVVDDDASVRESLRWMVGSLDLPVETYATAREFLGAQNGGRPRWRGGDLGAAWMGGAPPPPVQTYATPREFLGAQNGGRPGCLVVDLRMPEMGGLELQNELAAR